MGPPTDSATVWGAGAEACITMCGGVKNLSERAITANHVFAISADLSSYRHSSTLRQLFSIGFRLSYAPTAAAGV